MNKKLISLASAAALLFVSLGATVCAAEPEGYDYVIYDNNFENAETGSGLSEIDINYRPENANYAVIEENGGKYYTFSPESTEKLANSGNLETGIFHQNIVAVNPVQKLKLEIDLKLSGMFEAYLATYYRGVNAGGINGSRDNFVVFTEAGEYYVQNAPDLKRSYTPRQWMHFTIYADYANNVFSVYDDEGVLGENIKITSNHSVQCFTQIRTVIKKGNDSGCEVSIDNIVYSTTKEEYDKLELGGGEGEEESDMPHSYSKKIVDENFENTANLPASKWDRKGASGLSYTVADAQEEILPQADKHGKVAKIAKTNDTSVDNYFRVAYGLVAKECSIDELENVQTGFDIYVPEKTSINIRYLDNISGSSTKGDSLITFSKNGTFRCMGGTKSFEYTGDKWYSINVFLDFKADRYSVYVDGKLAEENLPLKNLDTCIISFGVQMAQTADTYTVYLDNMVFAVPDAFRAAETYPADGAQNANVLDSAVITMSNPIADFDSSYITVTENGSLYDGYETSCNENIITLNFPQGLEYASEYEIRISSGMKDIFDQILENDIITVFTTMERGLAAEAPVFTDKNGTVVVEWPESGEIKASAAVKNGSAEEKDIALITAVYDADCSMKEMYIDEKKVQSGAVESFETEITAEYNEECAVKAFICEKDGIYKMLREEYAALPSENTLLDEAIVSVSIDKLSLEQNKLIIDGKLSLGAVKTVLITVFDEKENIVLAVPVKSTSGGTFSYSFNLSDGTDGVFTVYAGGAKINNTDSKGIVYLTDAKKAEITETINKTDSIQSVKNVMEQNENLLNIDDIIFNSNTYRVIYEQKPYASYDKFIEMLVLSADLMKQINEADWSALTQLFEDYEEIILCGAENLSKYSSYDKSEKNKINQMLVKKSPFTDFEYLRKEFDAAVASYKKPSGGGGGGGGSRPSGGNVVSSAYNVTVQGNNEPIVNPNPEKEIFGDINLVPWAESSILGLYEKGIVSKDDNYRPLDNIKREEFVKLLAEMLELPKTSEECGFTDAENGQWYCVYLTAAKTAGIINGNTDGSFGIGSNITRQDMAVMAYRAVTAAGKTLTFVNNAEPFTDSEDIDEYAKTAVEEMHKAGIISGTGSGAFEPESYANRAQAAVIIYNLMCAADREAVK